MITLNRPAKRLSPRERQVLNLVADGQTNREIARSLNIAEGTVKAHVENILRKLGAADRTQAAVYAAMHGLVQASSPPS